MVVVVLLQVHIEALTGQVSGLRTENGSLHSRIGMLEKVLDMRNDQIQSLQDSKEVSSGAPWLQQNPWHVACARVLLPLGSWHARMRCFLLRVGVHLANIWRLEAGFFCCKSFASRLIIALRALVARVVCLIKMRTTRNRKIPLVVAKCLPIRN